MEQSATGYWAALAERLRSLLRGSENANLDNQASPEWAHPQERGQPSTESPGLAFGSILEKDEDFLEYPKGFPRFARMQDYFRNGSIHRRYGPLRQRLLQHIEVEIAKREARLLELDKEGEQEETCEKERLIEELIQLDDLYARMLYNDYKTRKLRRIDHHEYLNFFGTAKDLGILEGDAKDYLHAPSKDFVTTRPERLYDSLERLAFRVQISWLLKLLPKTEAPEGSPYESHFDPGWFIALGVVAIGLLCLLLFLLPVAILYFVQPSAGWSAGVVATFGLAFTVVLALMPRVQIENIFISLAAYVAIMVAFLVNFQGGQCKCQVSSD